jgi:hypothetical protein
VNDVTSTLLAAIVALVLIAHLAHLVRASRRKAGQALAADAATVAQVIDNASDISKGTAGVVTWAGTWEGQRVQVSTIVDTLATRKLPACWLSVSITEAVAVPAIFDVMVRPGSVTTFSNFDLLPHTLKAVPGCPAEAQVRTDRRDAWFQYTAVPEHFDIFSAPRTKELLITPNGVRIVWLLAEANRARYGVFRQADFGDAALEPAILTNLLRSASTIRSEINEARSEAA